MRAVVLTGTSTGIGRASALALDAEGFHVFAGVRKDKDGEALQAAASDRLTPVHLDVTDESSIAAARARVAETVKDAGLAGLVNNAGTTVPCPVEYLPLAEFRRQLEVMARTVSHHAASGSPPAVVAAAVVHALTSRRPKIRYAVGAGARRMLGLRRLLPDRLFDAVVLRAIGLE